MTDSRFLFGGAAAILVIVAARALRRKNRLRAARGEPAPGTTPASREALVAALQALSPPEAAFQTHEEDGHIVVTWQLHGIPWATLLFRRKLLKTQALELLLREGTVFARYREGSVSWQTAAATWMPKAIVEWRHPRGFDPGPPPSSADPPPKPTAESPRTFQELTRHVRPIVVASGWVFEPVLDFPG